MPVPTFPKLDPAQASFWEARYRENFTPWDAGGVPTRLREFVSGLPPGRVLVPGCGSGHDVRHFAESGWDVEGIDFTPAALEAARPILGPHAGRARLADFFGDEIAGPYSLVYERAFLCALPRRLWTDWGQRLAALVPRGGRLAGFFYIDDPDSRGPPFPLAGTDELDALLKPAFDRIEDRDVPDSIAVFAGKERWQVWRRA